MRITINKGLDVVIEGAPEPCWSDAPRTSRTGVVVEDYPGLRPVLRVREGERVARGQVLFEDRGSPDVCVTAPVAGRVARVASGAHGTLRSILLDRSGNGGVDEAVDFPQHDEDGLADMDGEAVRAILTRSGLWTSLRTRPFGRIPAPTQTAAALFVSAIDSEPLAPDPVVVLAEAGDAFRAGLKVLAKLVPGPVFLCCRPGADIPLINHARITRVDVSGPHPAGLPGTHIEHLAPVGGDRRVWSIGYQETAAIGRLFTDGHVDFSRAIALAGPAVRKPRLLRTQVGADILSLVDGELEHVPSRILSGSALTGRPAVAETAFLGPQHRQVCVLREDVSALGANNGPTSEPTGLRAWLRAAVNNTTTKSAIAPDLPSPPVFPLERFENRLPFSIPVVPLLRALATGDDERAAQLGCLQLVEEDLALCSYLCPSGIDYGALLRVVLDRLEEQGT